MFDTSPLKRPNSSSGSYTDCEIQGMTKLVCWPISLKANKKQTGWGAQCEHEYKDFKSELARDNSQSCQNFHGMKSRFAARENAFISIKSTNFSTE